MSTEKHDLGLLEDVEPDEIIQQLEGALAWLNNWSGPDSAMQALYDRILFRLVSLYPQMHLIVTQSFCSISSTLFVSLAQKALRL